MVTLKLGMYHNVRHCPFVHKGYNISHVLFISITTIHHMYQNKMLFPHHLSTNTSIAYVNGFVVGTEWNVAFETGACQHGQYKGQMKKWIRVWKYTYYNDYETVKYWYMIVCDMVPVLKIKDPYNYLCSFLLD